MGSHHQAFKRINRDIKSLKINPHPGIFAEPDENDATKIHALVEGPSGTPYEGGFFYFILTFPSDYPINPPEVKLRTTDGGRTSLIPHTYGTGYVCLSILSRRNAMPWTPDHTLGSVLISIQTLMKEDHGIANHGALRLSTIKVAVCKMLEGESDCRGMPEPLKNAMEISFLGNYRYYMDTCANTRQSNPCDGEISLRSSGLKMRLEKIKSDLEAKRDLTGVPVRG